MPQITRFAKRRKIKYPVLADKGSEVIRAFGLINQDYPVGSYAHGVAHPITIVFDENGIVTHRFSRAGYVRRPNIDAVISALRKDPPRLIAGTEPIVERNPVSAENPISEPPPTESILRRLHRFILNN